MGTGIGIDYDKVGLKAGLEIHQQLDTRTKLFCKCPTTLRDNKDSTYSFIRYLRASKSEMGEVDRAAREEESYSRTFLYKAYDEQGERAVGPLMGIVMAKYRGKVDGKEINRLLKTKVEQIPKGESDK